MNDSVPRLIELSEIRHESGKITVVEEGAHSPFAVKRVYYLHGLSAESERGSHAHHGLRQLMIAIAGQFRVHLTGPTFEKTVVLDNPNTALFIPPLTWRDLDQFTPGAICLVLASEVYDESDYIRDYDEFLMLKGLAT